MPNSPPIISFQLTLLTTLRPNKSKKQHITSRTPHLHPTPCTWCLATDKVSRYGHLSAHCSNNPNRLPGPNSKVPNSRPPSNTSTRLHALLGQLDVANTRDATNAGNASYCTSRHRSLGLPGHRLTTTQQLYQLPLLAAFNSTLLPYSPILLPTSTRRNSPTQQILYPHFYILGQCVLLPHSQRYLAPLQRLTPIQSFLSWRSRRPQPSHPQWLPLLLVPSQ